MDGSHYLSFKSVCASVKDQGGREEGGGKRRKEEEGGEKLNSSRSNAARPGTGPRRMPALSAAGRAVTKQMDTGTVTSRGPRAEPC